MRKSILAFPLPVSVDKAATFLADKIHLQLPEISGTLLIVPGCSLSFSGVLQGPVAGLEDIFEEHALLEPEELQNIRTHGSLFFLQCTLQSVADFNSLMNVIVSFLDGGALGIYMEQCGCALSASLFKSIAASDLPMEGFLNFIETREDLYTLGMESFGLPDVCISLTSGDTETLRNILSCVADALFMENLPVDTGTKWADADGAEFEFRKEAKLPYKKGSFEFNAQGVWRLIKRTKLGPL